MVDRSRVRCLVWVALAAVAWGVSTARGDMIVTVDGGVKVGRIVRERQGEIRLKTGSASSTKGRVITIARDGVRTIYRGLDEERRIDACRSAPQSARWAAGYFHAGLEIPAARCARRALTLDPSLGKLSPKAASKPFRLFWHRVALQQREAAVPKRDGRGRLRLARWAREVGLADDAARLLRDAWNAERSLKQVRELASAWDVRLGPAFRLDLTPALDAPLWSESLQDENTSVSAKPGHRFLTLPLRFDPAEPGPILSKSTFRGRFQRGIYGFRVLRVKGGRTELRWRPGEPVYERIELDDGAVRRGRIVARNSSGPQAAEGAPKPPARSGPRERQVSSKGWAAVVVEIPGGAKTLRVEWSGGSVEVLDLALLQQLGRPMVAAASDHATPVMASLLRKVSGASRGESVAEMAGSMTALAIARLARYREASGVMLTDAWHAAVEEAVVRAAMRDEDVVGPVAHAYLAGHGTIRESTRMLLERLAPDDHMRWIHIIGAAAERDTGFKASIGRTILGAILAGTDRASCESALDLMSTLGSQVDWNVLVHASATARSLALERLETEQDSAVARGILVALIQRADAASVEPLRRHAQRLGLEVSRSDDSILRHWATLENDEARHGFLTVLSSLSLGPVMHTEPYSNMLREATAPTASPQVREAAYSLIVAQASLHQPGDGTAFGLLIPRGSTDMMTQGLVRAMSSRERGTRQAALTALVRAGYAEEAVRGLNAMGRTPERRASIVEEVLSAAGDGALSPGMLSVLGHLLRPDWNADAIRLTRRLTRHSSAIGPSDRWQMIAAVKSGVDFSALSRLTMELDAAAAGTALRWMYELAHMSRQERQHFAATRDVAGRDRHLRDVDFRRGRLVDGRYGVLAILETAAPAEVGEDGLLWGPPERTAIVLPSVALSLNSDDDGYIVRWQDREIGSGVALDAPQRTRALAFYYGVMESLDPAPFITAEPRGGDEAETPGQTDGPRGPLVLRSGEIPDEPQPGIMRLRISDLLRAGFAGGIPKGWSVGPEWVPDALEIALRYTQFGGYCGTLPRRRLPEAAEVGHRHLLNVKLILERID